MKIHSRLPSTSSRFSRFALSANRIRSAGAARKLGLPRFPLQCNSLLRRVKTRLAGSQSLPRGPAISGSTPPTIATLLDQAPLVGARNGQEGADKFHHRPLVKPDCRQKRSVSYPTTHGIGGLPCKHGFIRCSIGAMGNGIASIIGARSRLPAKKRLRR